jgi:hypothetical protein
MTDFDRDATEGRKQAESFVYPYGRPNETGTTGAVNTLNGEFRPVESAPIAQPKAPNNQQVDWSNPDNYLSYLKGANPEGYNKMLSYVDPEKYATMVADNFRERMREDNRQRALLESTAFMQSIMGLDLNG